MSPLNFSGKKEHTKVGFVQVTLFLAIIVVLGWLFHFNLIPGATAGFVNSLFSPSGDLREKIGFVQFDGLTWASVSKENEAELAASNREISKDVINTEYVFDFTFKERDAKIHGYSKGAGEFYVKAPALGEGAIILEPHIGFSILSLVIAAFIAIIFTMFLPPSIGVMSALFDNQINHVKVKVRLQTGFTDEVVDILTMPDSKLNDYDRFEIEKAFRIIWDRTSTDTELATKKFIEFDDIFDDETDVVFFRNEAIYNRIKEFFSEFVVSEISDTKDGLAWRHNRLKIAGGFRLYMAHHFSEKYSNTVTGLAYGGAAVLIVAVGIRGLKFIPASKPSFILFAIFLEFTMLSLMAITLIYTEGEERMDKMMKKMEDANRSQLETLRGQQQDIHQLSTALVGQTSEIIKTRVENAISDYMTSGDHVQKEIAEAIANKIIFDLKPDSGKRK